MDTTYIDCILAGIGGQGVLTIGELLAYAAIDSDLNASTLPKFDTVMRGGNAICTVVLSSGPIGSPIIKHPKSLIAMSQSAIHLFQDLVEDSGFVLVNSSMAQTNKDDRIRYFLIPMNQLATDAKVSKMANMVALGAYITISKVVTMENVIAALNKVIPERYMHLKEDNIQALEIGAEYVNKNFTRV